jgi:hypothetical protein
LTEPGVFGLETFDLSLQLDLLGGEFSVPALQVVVERAKLGGLGSALAADAGCAEGQETGKSRCSTQAPSSSGVNSIGGETGVKAGHGSAPAEKHVVRGSGRRRPNV